MIQSGVLQEIDAAGPQGNPAGYKCWPRRFKCNHEHLAALFVVAVSLLCVSLSASGGLSGHSRFGCRVVLSRVLLATSASAPIEAEDTFMPRKCAWCRNFDAQGVVQELVFRTRPEFR